MSDSPEPIAIVGIGCRFPQADGPAAYWRLLTGGVDAISEVPASRFDARALYHPEPATPGKISTRWGGFLEDIDRFDADFFGVSPREAERLDPQQRLLLETAYEAFEDAGTMPERLAGTQTGVFVAMWSGEYEHRLFRDPRAVDFYMTIGTGRYAASGRLSFMFGLQGPSLTVDSGCSASLVSTHLACRSLRSGESDVALAAGVNVVIEPNITIGYSQSRMMSPDGRCKFGDERANGYVRGEGVAVVVLKRLSRALADGDRIYATILGSAVNNDGRTSGFLSTPGLGGQREMLQLAYRDAGIVPGQVSYVEAHGTGTQVGDRVEITAIGTVLAEGRDPSRPCRIGSVKTNIGHTEAVAGLAGLVKVALALHHGQLPPSLHYETPNPAIEWQSLPVRVQRQLEPWPTEAGELACAGVSSFGISGTNAHIVLRQWRDARTEPVSDGTEPRLHFLPISAHSEAALDARLVQWRDLLASEDASASLADLCWTAGMRRAHLDWRAAIAGRTRAALVEQIDALRAGEPRIGAAKGRRHADRRGRLVFVFPGQGSQWIGMGRQLLASNDAFRRELEAWDRAVQAYAGMSILEELAAPEASSRLRESDVVQPVLLAVEAALAAVWRDRGFEPAAVVGHSMGEVGAAYLGGAITLDEAARIICTRSRLMRRTSGQGAMALVELGTEAARTAIAGREHLLSVAVVNSARNTVLSGDPAALDAVLAELEAREVFCRRVKVDVASHSPQMDPLQPELRAALASLRPQAASMPIYSTVTGEAVDGEQWDAEYWVRNLREPVQFATTVGRMLADGYDTFIEMSPHPLLVNAVADAIEAAGTVGAVAVPSLRRDEDEEMTLAGATAALYAAGYAIPFDRLNSAAGRHATLPRYPWQRERFWFDAPSSLELITGRRSGPTQGGASHPLLATRVEIADRPGELAWELTIGSHSPRWLLEHRVGGAALLPASGSIELLLAAAAALDLGADAITLRDLVFESALVVGDQDVRVQVIAVPDGPGRALGRIYSWTGDRWQRHVAAILEASGRARTVDPDLDVLGARLDRDATYDRLDHESIKIGAPLQTLDSCTVGAGMGSARLALRPGAALDEGYLADPPLVDGALQLAALADRERDPEGGVPVPTGIDQLTWFKGFEAEMRTRAEAVHADAAGAAYDITVATAVGQVRLDIQGLRLARLESATPRSGSMHDWFFEPTWHALPPAAHAVLPARWRIVDPDGRLGEALAGSLVALRHEATVTREMDRATAARPGHIVFVAPERRASATEADTAADLAWSTVKLQRSLVEADQAARIWIVTTDAQRVRSQDVPDPSQATLWGLGRVIAEEHREHWGGLVDVAASDVAIDPAALAAAVADAVTAGDDDQVALRDGARYGLRLTRASFAGGTPLACRNDGTYVVVGGFGELGVDVAHWLVDHGARRLLVLGRTPLPPRAVWRESQPEPTRRRIDAIRAIEARGVSVHVAAVDVADREALAACLETFEREEWPPIRGIVQSAGVMDGRLLAQVTRSAFEAVMRPKTAGSWNLHALTARHPLEFFVLFSSFASLLPSSGQGSYAAGNAFVDALAHVRAARGLPGLAVNWGPWAGGGMAAEMARKGAGLADRGVASLTGSQSLPALARGMTSSHPQLIIASFDASRWARDGQAPPLLAVLAKEKADAGVVAGTVTDLRGRLAAAPSGAERAALLETVLQDHVARVLKQPVARIELTRPLRAMGLDSLMALELRNRLETLTGLRLPATLAWNYPTILDIVPFLASRLEISLDDVPLDDRDLEGASEDDLTRLLAEVEELSDEEARRLAAEGS
jgi:myxalamid-type polyketide synthase MxaD